MSPVLFMLVACDPDCNQCIADGECIDAATCPPTPVTGADVQAFMQKVVTAPDTSGYYTQSGGAEAPAPTTSATENHDGNYGIIARGPTHRGIGFLAASDMVNNPTPPGPPKGNNKEYFCASRSFAWPQFLGASASAGVVEWELYPISDLEPMYQACRGAPFNLDGTYDPTQPPPQEYPLDTSPTGAGYQDFFVQRCELGSGGTYPQCPAPAAGGGTVITGGRATTLRPGVYELSSSGINPGTGAITSGTGTLYVRATSNPLHALETYCFDDNFRWSRYNLNNWLPVGAMDFREVTVRVVPKSTAGVPDNAPDAPTCPASGQKHRADYCFSTDPAQKCFP